jgi:hypothetical protein
MANERIGILLVHGIGEQLEQGHLVGEASNVVLALEAALKAEATADPSRKFTIGVAHHRRDPARDLEARDPQAPLVVTVRWFEAATGRLVETKEFHFREAFWADLDEPATLLNNISFWFWAFSMWAVRWMPWQGNKSEGRRKYMRPTAPASMPISVAVRVRLLLTAIVFMPIVAGLTLFGTLAKKLGFGESRLLEFLVAYMGDIKLYQATHWSGGNRMPDIDQPPRIAIRRRMVRTLVDMALDGHDRWYVLAHSLGTVVALNGLMETAHCLPNHLDRERWNLCQQRFPTAATGMGGTEYVMQPRRPAWLAPTDVIDRAALFAGLRLLLTYGSPLDKFATLFPQVVPINQDGLPPSASWINIYDPLDPVAGHLQVFEGAFRPGAGPINRAHHANPVLLLNHTLYLKQRPARIDRPVDWVANVLLSDRAGAAPLEAPSGAYGLQDRGKPYRAAFAVLRGLEWALVWVLFVFFIRFAWGFIEQFDDWTKTEGLGQAIGWVLALFADSLRDLPWWLCRAFVVGAMVALGAGILRIAYEWWRNDQLNRMGMMEAETPAKTLALTGATLTEREQRGTWLQPAALLAGAVAVSPG